MREPSWIYTVVCVVDNKILCNNSSEIKISYHGMKRCQYDFKWFQKFDCSDGYLLRYRQKLLKSTIHVLHYNSVPCLRHTIKHL